MKENRNLLTRREVLKGAAIVSGVALAAPMLNRGRYRIFAGSLDEYSQRAIDLVKRSTVIDMLSVLTLDFTKQAKWFADPESFTVADLQPYKDSGINVFHIAIGLGGPEAYEETLKFFASWNGFIADQDDYFMRIDSPADLDRVKQSSKIGILLGLQNSDQFPFDIQRVFWTYDVPGGEQRGGHAYYKQHELIIALSGSFDVVITAPNGQTNVFNLNRSYYGLLVPAKTWRHIDNFSTNSLGLHLSSMQFDSSDYIRDFEIYKNMIHE